MPTLKVWLQTAPLVPVYEDTHNSLMKLKNDAIRAVTGGTPADYREQVEDVAIDVNSGVLDGTFAYTLYMDDYIVELSL